MAGTLWHSILERGGRWRSVDAQHAGEAGPFRSASCAALNDEDLHIVAVVAALPNGVVRTVRRADGRWGMPRPSVRRPDGGWVEVEPGWVEAQDRPRPFRSVACAGSNGHLHLVAIDNDKQWLWHFTDHRPRAYWYPSHAAGAVGRLLRNNRAPLWGVGCADVDGELHVVAASDPVRHPGSRGLGLWHAIRHRGGNWSGWKTSIETEMGEAFGRFHSAACAGGGGYLHLVAWSDDRLVHAMRRPDASWSAFVDVAAQHASPPNRFLSVGCADVGGKLHVIAVDEHRQKLWHTVRYPDGSWNPEWLDVDTLVAGRPARTDPVAKASGEIVGQKLNAIDGVSCAVLAGKVHMLALIGEPGLVMGRPKPGEPQGNPAGAR